MKNVLIIMCLLVGMVLVQGCAKKNIPSTSVEESENLKIDWEIPEKIDTSNWRDPSQLQDSNQFIEVIGDHEGQVNVM